MGENELLDQKVSKKHYPRTNSNKQLQFVFEKDPNLYLRKHKIAIKGAIEVGEDFVVENGWVAKLFKELRVEVDSQAISVYENRFVKMQKQLNSVCSSEFFLADYIIKRGNFNEGFIESDYTVEGYYDGYNYDAAHLVANKAFQTHRRDHYDKVVVDGKAKYRYEFVFVPNIGFLSDSIPLLNDCELTLTFERAPASAALLRVKGADEAPDLEIKDCHAVTQWVSSPSMASFFKDVEHNPIVYKFDEIEVLTKNIPMHERIIRLDNIRGGNIPTYIFAGMISSDALSGDASLSSTNFACNNIQQFNITLNGHSVNGYPINVNNNSDTNVLYQFNDTIGRLHNNACGYGMKKSQFQCNYIWAHHFEAEITSQGWIGMDITLKEALTKNYSLIIWLVFPASVSIDKFHTVERNSH